MSPASHLVGDLSTYKDERGRRGTRLLQDSHQGSPEGKGAGSPWILGVGFLEVVDVIWGPCPCAADKLVPSARLILFSALC